MGILFKINFVFFLPSQCRETFWIESFHTAMLIYVSKRIHYGDDTYNMRIELAVLHWVTNFIFLLLNFLSIISSLLSTASMSFIQSTTHVLIFLLRSFIRPFTYLGFFFQNENVNREVSSLQMYQHARHPNRLAETRVLVEKTFKFRATIWSRFFGLNT